MGRRFLVAIAACALAVVVAPVPSGASSSAKIVTKPDKKLTPGAISDLVTQANIQTTICVEGYTRKPGVRHVTATTRKQVFSEYHVKKSDRALYKIDHLIPLEVGGSNAINNLWPEPNKQPK